MTLFQRSKAILLLEDGTFYIGRSFGANGTAVGEVVFNTSHTGYQEIITDPSYRGQIVLMTASHIGNYGVADEDEESPSPFVEGLIVREASRIASNPRAMGRLPEYLEQRGVVAVEQVDTRAITRKIRDKGAMKALITTDANADINKLLQRLESHPGLAGRNLVQEVVSPGIEKWDKGFTSPYSPPSLEPPEGPRKRLLVLDCGVKRSILKSLVAVGFEVFTAGYNTPIEEMEALRPDALLLSNGPGDPEPLAFAINTVKAFSGKIPIFGICLGHQVIALSFGARTYKMKFGHHGANHPVKETSTGRIYITSQNHSFAVDLSGKKDLRTTHLNLNDGTIEGLEHVSLPVWSIQFHPEAGPGPHDAIILFKTFKEKVDMAPST